MVDEKKVETGEVSEVLIHLRIAHMEIMGHVKALPDDREVVLLNGEVNLDVGLLPQLDLIADRSV